MKRILSATAIALLTMSLSAGVAGAGGRAKLQLRHTKLGEILVDSGGYTLYAFSKDRRNHDACLDIAGCIYAWPAVTTGGAVVTGPGVKSSLIGTISIGARQRQVTYAGHPLYTFVSDTGPGDTQFVNFLQFGGRWPALNGGGHLVK